MTNTNSIDFTVKDLLEKIGSEPTCYLTGEAIDISDSSSYSLDHIVPKSKGGQNTLDNLGLTTQKANMSKSDMALDEYLMLCKKVLENHGYTVTK